MYDPQLMNFSNFEDNPNMNISTNEFIPVIIDNENHLKYNKYSFNIDMSSKSQSNNTNTKINSSNLNDIGIDVEKISNIANTGIGLMGTFLTSVNDSLKEFEENVGSNKKKNSSENSNSNMLNKITYYSNEDDNYYYLALEIPRVKKEDCNVKVHGNTLTVIAKTEALNDGFAFLENRELEVSIEIPFSFNPHQIIARNSNGMLYISINKNLFVDNNININILD